MVHVGSGFVGECTVLICHCRAVSDQALRRHLLAGVAGERDLIVRSGAGGRCGGCRPQLRRLLADHAAGRAAEGDPARRSADRRSAAA